MDFRNLFLSIFLFQIWDPNTCHLLPASAIIQQCFRWHRQSFVARTQERKWQSILKSSLILTWCSLLYFLLWPECCYHLASNRGFWFHLVFLYQQKKTFPSHILQYHSLWKEKIVLNNCVENLHTVEDMNMKNLKAEGLEINSQDKEMFLTQ